MPTRTSANTKLLFSIISIVLCSLAAKAQPSACQLKAEQLKPAAELYGLHLGMSREEVKTALPLVQFGRADRLGVMRTSFNPHFDPRVDQTAFPDVRTISLDFLDDKLATIWIGYENTFKWPKLDEFILNFSKSLGVGGEWPAARNGRALGCDGFLLSAQMIAGGPSLRINDENAQTVAIARLAEAIDADEKQVVGDLRSKSYYPADCAARNDVPPASRAVFKNKEDAEKAGYTLAKDCQ
ncbi:MAG TPA: hypothetical protein VE961_24160 [Pyrinomonadaceae bacterium]|nr:hypothetical protein [Pyrinomonadaceae bacterium]